ncbi:MAG: hypothetical protein M4579_003495 [Chaenotheca gracillima]|nr:MAG: hypothetical protein M4579_003495 [Chaenotheca gracillima]
MVASNALNSPATSGKSPTFSHPPPPPPPPPSSNHAGLQSIPETTNGQPARRSSLGFLRRMKSGERVSGRSSSGAKLTKKQQALQQEEALRRERESKSRSPPRLPDLYNGLPPQPIRTFGESSASDSNTPVRASTSPESTSVPIPPIPGTYTNARGEFVDPYARTESMTHRGRYSFASTAVSTINSPRRVRRRKDPTPFNILVIGARNSGKTSFLEFLRSSLANTKQKGGPEIEQEQSTSAGRSSNAIFTSQYIETDIEGERVGLTLWDSQGLEKHMVDLQLRQMSSFLESKFEDTFNEEMKVVRAPGVQDTHIHCVFLILDPVRLDQNIKASSRMQGSQQNGMSRTPAAAKMASGLDEHFDLQVLRTLQGKTTVIPVISKADTLTTAHMIHLKKAVWNSIKKSNLDPLEVLGLDEADNSSSDSSIRNSRINEKDEEDDDSEESGFLPKQSNVEPNDPTVVSSNDRDIPRADSPTKSPIRPQHRRSPSAQNALAAASPEQIPYLPLSIISPDSYDPGTIGRKFPWGLADPYNEEHCDFVRLKEAVFSDWRGELREASREMWYEGWRTSRLNKRRNLR